MDLSRLNFGYALKGRASWKPTQVYDDGKQTFIRLPESTATGEMPILLVRKASGNVLVNYRVKERTMSKSRWPLPRPSSSCPSSWFSDCGSVGCA